MIVFTIMTIVRKLHAPFAAHVVILHNTDSFFCAFHDESILMVHSRYQKVDTRGAKKPRVDNDVQLAQEWSVMKH